MKTSFYRQIDTALFASLLLFLLAAIYGKATGTIGFLSDDWSLIHRAATSPFWQPAEQHHYSLIINLLFKGVAFGYLNASSIHLLAFVVHSINVFIFYFLVRDVLKRPPFEAKLVAGLFAVSPAGLEAITWCCAVGYVLCAFWILIGVYRFLKIDDHPVSLKEASVLAGLQLGAFLCWDWGLILAPSLGILCFVPHQKSDSPSLKKLQALWPLLLTWTLLLFIKRAIGQDFGYAFNSPWHMAANFITVPLLSIFPQFSKEFYTSFAGMISAIILFFAMLWTAWHNKASRAMLALLFIWQLPLVFLGYPQSRYFYLLALPVYFISVQCLMEIAERYTPKMKRPVKFLGLMAVLGMGSLYVIWSFERVLWWEKASEQAVSIYHQIEAASEQESKPLVVINMPDRYGPEGMIWLPYLWRCGLVHFTKPFTQMYTSECLHPPSDSTLLSSSKEILKENDFQHVFYEVRSIDQGRTLLLVKPQT